MVKKRVEKFDWYANHTFKHQQFKDINKLLHLKEEGGHAISLCLPTMNEASTIENILKIIKKKLQIEYPLLDEICLMDGGSTDGTVEIAREMGIDVFFQDQIMRKLGKAQGKGDALWKSLFCTRGDIVVWIDADIRNIHPRFVYGLVGPLLHYPHIHIVKGFYQRPIASETRRLRKTGGGRVTELVARPLLSFFYPYLTALIQPLSGEYAGRRKILEAIPFFTGYGVEIGMIIEIYKRFGMEAIAQVDLVERVHYNQTLSALGRMSFGVIQAMLIQLQEDEKIELKEPFNHEFTQVDYKNGSYFLEKMKIDINKRPPMLTVKEYRKKFKLNDGDETL